MAEFLLDKLRVHHGTFDASDGISEKTLYAHPELKSVESLDNVMTYLVGNQFKEGLMQRMTIGAALSGVGGTVREIEVNGSQYTWDVMGEIDKNDIIAESLYTVGDRPGEGLTSFRARFQSNWFKKGWVIESTNKVQCWITAEPVRISDSVWEYTLVPINIEPSAFVPLDELAAGTMWTDMFVPVTNVDFGEAPSTGRRVLPGKAQNVINTLRHSWGFKGNIANISTKNVKISVPNSMGNTENYIVNSDLWNFERECVMMKETMLMYSEYNMNIDGTTKLRDNAGEYVKIGAGILEQIPNRDSYSVLTYDKIRRMIMDIFYGRPATEGMDITLVGGQGFIEEFDKACKDYLVKQSWNIENDKIIEGSDRSRYGINGYFSSIAFIGGYRVTVVHHPIFDYGKRAMKDNRHPVTGYPMESYSAIFLDSSGFSGDPNLQYVYQKGLRMIQKVMPGLNDVSFLNGLSNYGDLTVSEKGESSIHRVYSCGAVLRSPLKSLYVTCNLS